MRGFLGGCGWIVVVGATFAGCGSPSEDEEERPRSLDRTGADFCNDDTDCREGCLDESCKSNFCTTYPTFGPDHSTCTKPCSSDADCTSDIARDLMCGVLGDGSRGCLDRCSGVNAPSGLACVDGVPTVCSQAGDGYCHHCGCPDGTVCADNGNCNPCPVVAPDEAMSFDACGGEPFGTWRLTGLEATGMVLTLYEQMSNGALVEAGACPTELVTQSESFDLLLDFADGGGFRSRSGAFTIQTRVENQCVLDTVGMDCDALVPEGICFSDDCGICHCSFGSESSVAGEAEWTRQDSQLLLDGTPSFNYCVSGDSMELVTLNGVRYSLERVYGVGRPTPCAERTLETCRQGNDCSIGVCTGDAVCSGAANEGDCTNQMGCSWDPNVCSGTAPRTCTLDDFDVITGCEWLPAPATCTGTPSACNATDVAVLCGGIPGCTWGPGCTGGTFDCQQFDCAFCNTPGCMCSQTQGCIGTPTCESLTDDFECNETTECTWVDATCRGTPMACEMLDVPTCSRVPGCSVVTGT